MYPYFALLLIPGLLQAWLSSTNTVVRVNTREPISGKQIALPVFFAILLILLAVRDKSVGRDLGTYRYIFNHLGNSNFTFDMVFTSEWLFRLYCWFVYQFISTNYQVFLAITAVLTILPIACVYCQDKEYGYMKAAIFVNMSTFIMLFSGIRQSLAMAIGMLAYVAVKKKRLFGFFVLSVIAASIHHTGFMVFLLLPLYRMRFRKKDLIWIAPFWVAVFIFSKPIFNILTRFASILNEQYDVTASSTGAFGSFLLFILFAFFCFLITDEKNMDEETIGLRNILVFSVFLQSFAMVNYLVMRMNYYFILLIPITIGKCVHFRKNNYRQVATVGVSVLSTFFTLYFFYGIYRSYVTGLSTLDTVPYIPFWKGNF